MGKNSKKVSERTQVVPFNAVYQMTVTLKGIRPPIWRRVQVTSDTLLWGLHGILQAVMGWEDEHPHRFLINGTYYGDPGLSSTLLKVVDEESVRLNQLISAEKDKFLYQYGSGTGWDHEVRIEKVVSRENGQRYPICLDGKRACPPEHCTGPWKYREFLKTLKDPSRSGEKHRKAGMGEDFHPEEFDRESVHRRLGWS